MLRISEINSRDAAIKFGTTYGNLAKKPVGLNHFGYLEASRTENPPTVAPATLPIPHIKPTSPNALTRFVLSVDSASNVLTAPMLPFNNPMRLREIIAKV
jgi:hypothetical protein